MKSTIDKIQNWYLNHCNLDWEHQNGIKIDTLDNPGWSVLVNLIDTEFENTKFILEIENGDSDWIKIKANDNLFMGVGDPSKLSTILEIFTLKFIENKFYQREEEEKEWMLQNTWCNQCNKADLGMSNPKEYSEKHKVLISGKCLKCGNEIISKVTNERTK